MKTRGLPFLLLLLLLALTPQLSRATDTCDLAIQKVLDTETALDDARGNYTRLHDEGQAAYEKPVSNVHSSHHDWANATGEDLKYMWREGKTPMPADTDAVFADAIAVPSADGRNVTFWGWSKECGCWYRYMGSEQGGSYTVHWNGMSEPTVKGFKFPGPGGKMVAPKDVPWDFEAWLDEFPQKVRDMRIAMRKVRESTKAHSRAFLEVFGEEPKDTRVFGWEQ